MLSHTIRPSVRTEFQQDSRTRVCACVCDLYRQIKKGNYSEHSLGKVVTLFPILGVTLALDGSIRPDKERTFVRL